MRKKLLAAMAAAMLSICCLSGCGNGPLQENVNKTVQQETNGSSPEVSKKDDAAILVVSFGTSYNESRDITIGAIENSIGDAFPEYEVRRAFTSQIIIDILKEREGLEIDNVEEALDRAIADGIKELIVQPTHLMQGYEYGDLAKSLTDYADKFDKIILAEPLLVQDADFDAVTKAITEKTASYDDGETAICFMGHGTEAESNSIYARLQDRLTEGGYENYYIGTVEAEPGLEDVAAALKAKGGYKKVILEPLMVVAGDHANNDMAGEEEGSWKMVLEKEGYEVECIMEGLGQIQAIRDIYVEHLKTALEQGTGIDRAEAGNSTGVSGEGAGGTGSTDTGIAGNTELSSGTYLVDVESSSSMFKVVKAELTVAGEEMTAVITLSGTGYSMLYMGTAEQAAGAAEADCIPFVEDAEGAYTYTVPVAALDQPIDCAAYSKKKEEWYDRQLTFLSASVTDGNGDNEGDKGNADNRDNAGQSTSGDQKPENGTYTIELIFGGGSGKSKILSPASITVAGDKMTASIEWSSSNYDYMIVDGEKYLPTNTEGNSRFEIPVSALDTEITVIGDTVAMSKPHEIEYTLTFQSDTMKAAE